eukprot:7589899-Karenia_brevis.AAC.1
MDANWRMVEQDYHKYTRQQNTQAMWTHLSTSITHSVYTYITQEGAQLDTKSFKNYGSPKVVQ